ncbi:hypothetical protein [Urechidicola vernalis]|uniref:Uncharacterized protein n=1 Tax=Urechidicola vernalis TaxID=3075600 RepID=A0ABU2Y8G6_9FLAO|nr:hypothetical protein [Urechidicola sp. P050]MDT0554337.1 hypothetical protein [Urechidicola sp. P050]
MNMITNRIVDLKENLPPNSEYLTSINSLEKMLNEIDFESEMIPHDDLNKMHQLFRYIKGSELTSKENKIIEQLITT